MADSTGCANTAGITVSMLTLPSFSVSMTTQSSTEIYAWSPAANLSCSDCASPVASPNEATTYGVKASDGFYTNTACVLVSVEGLCEGEPLLLPMPFSERRRQ